MSTNRLKTVVGMILLFSYCLLMALTCYFNLTGIYSEGAFKAVTAILQPVSFTFISLVITDAIKTRHLKNPGRRINPSFCILSIFLATFHTMLIAVILIEQANHHYPIESLTLYLGSVESFFGLCLGAVIRSLFEDTPAA